MKFNNIKKEEIEELQKIELYKSLNNWGIQSGWIPKIKKVGLEIEQFCKENNIPLPRITQIKSKFGTLRFYYIDETKNEQLQDIIYLAEDEINKCCEICGKSPSNLYEDNGLVKRPRDG